VRHYCFCFIYLLYHQVRGYGPPLNTVFSNPALIYAEHHKAEILTKRSATRWQFETH